VRFIRAAIALIAAATVYLPSACFSQEALDEHAIRQVLDVWVQAINAADLSTLLAQYSDDAMIDSKVARGKVSKQKYAEAMAGAFRTHSLVGMAADIAKVTFVARAHATVRATIYPMTNARRYVYLVEWRLEKRDGRWVIVEADYKSRDQEALWFEVT